MPAKFALYIEPEAIQDIQDAVDYYNKIKINLGKKFFIQIEKHFKFIVRNPKAVAIRYDKIRCLPVKKFPYMIHFQENDVKQRVTIKAVFSTWQDPSNWEERASN